MDAYNAYKILELGDFASEAEIRKSYKKLALKYHPDRQTNKNDLEKAAAEAQFKLVSNAHELLMDPEKKAVHDSNLRPTKKDDVPPSPLKPEAWAKASAKKNIGKPMTQTEKILRAVGLALWKLAVTQNRYPLWVSIPFWIMEASLAIGLVFVVLAVALVLGIPMRAAFLLEKKVLNFITNSAYNEQLAAFVTPEKRLALAKTKLTEAGVNIDAESDANLLNIYLDIAQANGTFRTTALEALDKEIINSIDGISHVGLVSMAFQDAITKPLTGGALGNIASLFLRTLRVILAIPLILLETSLRLIDAVINVALHITLGVAAVVLAATLFTMNLPLYAKDGLAYITGNKHPTPHEPSASKAPEDTASYNAFFNEKPEARPAREPSQTRDKAATPPSTNSAKESHGFFSSPKRSSAERTPQKPESENDNNYNL